MYSVIKSRAGRGAMLAALLGAIAFIPATKAQPLPLAPLTKLRLTVVQFVAATGDYRRWDALGGELDVGPDGMLTVPTLGSIEVAGMTPDQLGAEIANRLQTKLGLLDVPDAVIQILAYPPVYVAGGVSHPGQYAFQPGMTVAQAMALAGGERRSEAASSMSETIKFEADLAGFDGDILRTKARIARLRSEFARAALIAFPAELKTNDPATVDIVSQEKLIFEAHKNEMSRQQAGLSELAELYKAEIAALQQKAEALERQVAQAEKQVENVKALVNSGSATVSRLNDAERALADLRSQVLDNVLASMRAQEDLSRSQRDLAKLQDEQQSQTAAALQQEQAALEKLLLNQTATLRMLRQSEEFDQQTVLARTAQIVLAYSILRQEDGQIVTIRADEGTALLPGDLIKVTTQMQLPPSTTPAALADSRVAPQGS